MSAASTARLGTRSGLQLAVRPATIDDEPTLSAFFDAVNEVDRRFRFFAAGAHVSQEQLRPLIHADHFASESFLAFDEAEGILVASALLACDGSLDTAEIAVSVRDDYRGKGVGWAMMDLLAEEAARRGVRRILSIESRENHAAIELEREKGFVATPMDDDPSLVMLTRLLR